MIQNFQLVKLKLNMKTYNTSKQKITYRKTPRSRRPMRIPMIQLQLSKWKWTQSIPSRVITMMRLSRLINRRLKKSHMNMLMKKQVNKTFTKFIHVVSNFSKRFSDKLDDFTAFSIISASPEYSPCRLQFSKNVVESISKSTIEVEPIHAENILVTENVQHVDEQIGKCDFLMRFDFNHSRCR